MEKHICVKVFNNDTSKICARQSFKKLIKFVILSEVRKGIEIFTFLQFQRFTISEYLKHNFKTL